MRDPHRRGVRDSEGGRPGSGRRMRGSGRRIWGTGHCTWDRSISGYQETAVGYRAPEHPTGVLTPGAVALPWNEALGLDDEHLTLSVGIMHRGEGMECSCPSQWYQVGDQGALWHCHLSLFILRAMPAPA
ncbi:hypothetical protein BTVI_48168 [Pitangus sulphuratus]|nr:hypothetical protein BTVI_48168 [Pitangus sulphuratus]